MRESRGGTPAQNHGALVDLTKGYIPCEVDKELWVANHVFLYHSPLRPHPGGGFFVGCVNRLSGISTSLCFLRRVELVVTLQAGWN